MPPEIAYIALPKTNNLKKKQANKIFILTYFIY